MGWLGARLLANSPELAQSRASGFGEGRGGGAMTLFFIAFTVILTFCCLLGGDRDSAFDSFFFLFFWTVDEAAEKAGSCREMTSVAAAASVLAIFYS